MGRCPKHQKKTSSSGYIVFGDVNDCQRRRNPGHVIYKRIRKYFEVLRHLFLKDEKAHRSVVVVVFVVVVVVLVIAVEVVK